MVLDEDDLKQNLY